MPAFRFRNRQRHSAANGAIPRLGRPLGVTTPVNDAVVGIIRARERRMLASMVTQ